MKTMILGSFGFACACLFATGGKAFAADPKPLGRMDMNFTTAAAQGGMLEVKLGQLAMEKGANQKVKDFGQRMVTDHGKANQKLMDIAKAKSVTLDATIDAKHQKEVDRFSKLSGADFDKEYITMMLDDHMKDVKEFDHEATKGTDADLKAFAAETGKTVKGHLDMAKTIAPEVGVKVPADKMEKKDAAKPAPAPASQAPATDATKK